MSDLVERITDHLVEISRGGEIQMGTGDSGTSLLIEAKAELERLRVFVDDLSQRHEDCTARNNGE